ncbi:ATPase, T2SS/T4P/T4SS family [Sedimentibacter sp. MB31-C6]|uniref:ATPase, T2SS/T4P/T4SS family n=1 Tax=Sedimentibacter sp. MB31-C6 TaxID=3109366 RepID=UPI002DDCFABD|nr:ATPase, T2SS/T4P/T4SS family [Sedimentibacter sp. MB36-C1]WSI05132.1 ATPase, T2SS/T4P/T4SS family [Sedimentibacter sp. MB36-C1]
MDRKQIKEKIYNKIVNKDDFGTNSREHTERLINCSKGDLEAKEYVRGLIKQYLSDDDIEDDELAKEIFAEKWGLGILEKYDRPDVDEIMVHGTRILLQIKGEPIEVEEKFNSYDEVIAVTRRVLEFDRTKDLNIKNAMISARRKDGSRIQAVIPPVGKMPYLNIRKFESFMPTTENMLKEGTLTQEEINVLSTLVKGRANIVVIGEMGSGKTTFLKWLIQFFNDDLIIGSLETTFELNLDNLYPEKYFIQLEERLPDYPIAVEFATMLRQNVDVILVGECRSYEVNELIKAMSRGHSGSLGSAHSMGPMEVIDDFADMVLESGKSVDLGALKYRIARAVDIVVKFRKLPNRKRVMAGLYEIVADETSINYSSVPLFEFELDEEDPRDDGRHVRKGTITDKLKQKLNSYGVSMNEVNKVFD